MNKGINRIAAAVGALAIGLSCTGGATTNYPLLPFPRQETPVRLDDLFQGVEITPLETTEASLLSYPELLKTAGTPCSYSTEATPRSCCSPRTGSSSDGSDGSGAAPESIFAHAIF